MISWYLLFSLIPFFSLKLDCFRRYTKKYTIKFFHCSSNRTATFFRVTQRVDECLMVKWTGSSVTFSKALKSPLQVLDNFKKLLISTMNGSTSKFKNFKHVQKHYEHCVKDMFQYQEKMCNFSLQVILTTFSEMPNLL